jgi:ribosomal protein S12 methylthiotransferase
MSTGVYFVSLGCPKNLVDSQVMLGKLQNADYQIVTQPESAEVIVVNTCSFIEAAKEESIDTIFEMAQYKQSAKCQALVVSGCMAQRYSDQLQSDMPEIDLIIGTGQYHRIVEFLDSGKKYWTEGQALPQRVYIDQPAFIHSEKDERTLTGHSYTAFLKISEGCNRRCAFCIIPKLRGNVRSRTIESLVEEAQKLAKTGVRELNLVAQDLTEYGMEWKYRENLEKLLPELCNVDGIEWIRLHYVYPDQFSDELIEIIAREPKIVKYLDMPIQHTNDRVLNLMNRRLTKVRLFDLVEKMRNKIPGIVFRTSIIVGFPTETEQEFQELADDLMKLKLDHVGVFSYSQEEDTVAGKMADQVKPSVRKARLKKLKTMLDEQSLVNQNKNLNKIVPVLIEGAAEETDLLIQGRMPTQAAEIDGRVLINEISGLSRLPKPGDLVEVELTEVMPHEYVATARRFLK